MLTDARSRSNVIEHGRRAKPARSSTVFVSTVCNNLYLYESQLHVCVCDPIEPTSDHLNPPPDAVPKKRGPKTDVLEALLKRVDGLEKRLHSEGKSEGPEKEGEPTAVSPGEEIATVDSKPRVHVPTSTSSSSSSSSSSAAAPAATQQHARPIIEIAPKQPLVLSILAWTWTNGNHVDTKVMSRRIDECISSLCASYKGTDAVIKYYDPDRQPPLPLVELPLTLNPFHNDKVRIYAKMLTALPAQNVKALPGAQCST